MFFVIDKKIVRIDRLSGESNKEFYKKGNYVAGKGVSTDKELKQAIAEYNLNSF